MTSINGITFTAESGIEFRSTGSYATNGGATWGGCDESGTWTTANNIITTIVTAVSLNGAGCSSIGQVESLSYLVQGNTVTFTGSGGETLVYTKA